MPSLKQRFSGKHVVITGGSEGIGLALACELVQAHSNVTLISRSTNKLQAAQAKLQELATACHSSSRVHIESADVTNFLQVKSAVAAAEAKQGHVDVLISCAGASTPGYFHDQEVDEFDRMMRLNYLGTVHSVKAVYDSMVARNSGYIVMVSSTLGLLGFAGYSAYAPSKYAVRGLAECLRNELQGTQVKVSIAFPPDTATPGFENENKTKPVETVKISEGSQVFTSEQVAKCIAKGMAKGLFILPNPDLGLVVHTHVVKGMVPRRFPWLLLEMLGSFIGPIVHMVYAWTWDKISRKHAPQRFSKLWGASNKEH